MTRAIIAGREWMSSTSTTVHLVAGRPRRRHESGSCAAPVSDDRWLRRTDLGMNERAWALADRCAARAAELRVGESHAPQRRARDRRRCRRRRRARRRAGAGRLCMGGLGHVDFVAGRRRRRIVGRRPGLDRSPGGRAAWPRSTPAGPSTPDGYFAMGSGPLRAKARVEKRALRAISATRRTPTRGVLVLEDAHAADRRAVAAWVARKARRHAGAADHVRRRADGQPGRRRADRGARHRDRSAQDGHARLRRPPRGQRHAARRRSRRWPRTTCAPSGAPTTACCMAARPATPCAPTTTSCATWPSSLPSTSSNDYGTPFYDIFKRYDNDFYKIDPLLFSPAEVWLTSASSGRTFHAGD